MPNKIGTFQKEIQFLRDPHAKTSVLCSHSVFSVHRSPWVTPYWCACCMQQISIRMRFATTKGRHDMYRCSSMVFAVIIVYRHYGQCRPGFGLFIYFTLFHFLCLAHYCLAPANCISPLKNALVHCYNMFVILAKCRVHILMCVSSKWEKEASTHAQ